PAWAQPPAPPASPERRAIQEGHLANIQRLADAGKLLLAGPFTDGGELRGLFVFQVASLEEAKAMCDSDPAVKAGRLRVELHPWYSAKGISVPKPATPAQ
ncbi:MAG TPA: YciI family protein, partial [Candidatus Polarisedimenticolia bacterium]|nr:YciI family protein [Candidatus Polarisedimenticolia bacterium]